MRLARGTPVFGHDRDRQKALAAEFDPSAFLALLSPVLAAALALQEHPNQPAMVPGRYFGPALLKHYEGTVQEPPGYADLVAKLEAATARLKDAESRIEQAEGLLRRRTQEWTTAAQEWALYNRSSDREAMERAQSQAQTAANEVKALQIAVDVLRSEAQKAEAAYIERGQAVDTAKAVALISGGLQMAEAACLLRGLAAVCEDLIPGFDSGLGMLGARVGRDFRPICAGLNLQYLSAERMEQIRQKFGVSLTQPVIGTVEHEKPFTAVKQIRAAQRRAAAGERRLAIVGAE